MAPLKFSFNAIGSSAVVFSFFERCPMFADWSSLLLVANGAGPLSLDRRLAKCRETKSAATFIGFWDESA